MEQTENRSAAGEYLQTILEECMAQLDELGVPYGKVTEIAVNSRARRRWGQCRKVQDGWKIAISDRLLVPEAESGLRDTVMHELIHTCPMCTNHGAMWKHFAEAVNQVYGYHIRRTASSTDMGLQEEQAAAALRWISDTNGNQAVRKR
ncbi:MAG: SprT-like domain-containing protein [Lachnospiraceae bacterium]|nr:SprT-like domain-containing protein [Lachnospiraceae bacterium]